MKLIVESGATKSTWVLLDGKEVKNQQLLTGINPTNNPSSVDTVLDYKLPENADVKSVYFYGAGASSTEANKRVTDRLLDKFGKIDTYIEHDIVAAARSVSDGVPSIVSILGTGTNTIVFDGVNVKSSRKALGYIFADYGSGFYLGKLVMRYYYEHLMSDMDTQLFRQKYIRDGEDLVYKVYNHEKPNYYVAQFTYFLSDCSPELRQAIVSEAFSAFYEKQILPIKECKSLPLNFVGSVSSVFEIELRSIGLGYGLTIDKVVGNPIAGLIDYHRKLN